MKGLLAFDGSQYVGRVVDSGVSRDAKWVTVLTPDGEAKTSAEDFWSYQRPEDMLFVHPDAVREVLARQEAIGPKNSEVARTEVAIVEVTMRKLGLPERLEDL